MPRRRLRLEWSQRRVSEELRILTCTTQEKGGARLNARQTFQRIRGNPIGIDLYNHVANYVGICPRMSHMFLQMGLIQTLAINSMAFSGLAWSGLTGKMEPIRLHSWNMTSAMDTLWTSTPCHGLRSRGSGEVQQGVKLLPSHSSLQAKSQRI